MQFCYHIIHHQSTHAPMHVHTHTHTHMHEMFNKYNTKSACYHAYTYLQTHD